MPTVTIRKRLPTGKVLKNYFYNKKNFERVANQAVERGFPRNWLHTHPNNWGLIPLRNIKTHLGNVANARNNSGRLIIPTKNLRLWPAAAARVYGVYNKEHMLQSMPVKQLPQRRRPGHMKEVRNIFLAMKNAQKNLSKHYAAEEAYKQLQRNAENFGRRHGTSTNVSQYLKFLAQTGKKAIKTASGKTFNLNYLKTISKETKLREKEIPKLEAWFNEFNIPDNPNNKEQQKRRELVHNVLYNMYPNWRNMSHAQRNMMILAAEKYANENRKQNLRRKAANPNMRQLNNLLADIKAHRAAKRAKFSEAVDRERGLTSANFARVNELA